MRRGLIAVGGAAGEGFGKGMIAGSLFAFGTPGRYAGVGMKRGTIAALGPDRPEIPPSFAATGRYRFPFLALYLRQLAGVGLPGSGRGVVGARWSVTMATLRTAGGVKSSCGPGRTKAETEMDLNGRSLQARRVASRTGRGAEGRRPPDREGGPIRRLRDLRRGGLEAGIELARICMADLADVSLVPGDVEGRACPLVQVVTDHPVEACLASQYAGWAIQEGKFFAMGSGPMRAASGKEAVFDKIGRREEPEAVVGVLETRKPPNAAVVGSIASACRVSPSSVLLLVAPTASLAGGVQVVARSVETALHKLGELGFDVNRVVSAYGSAPLPPVARDDLAAIGRTNDAILYGARVVLFVRRRRRVDRGRRPESPFVGSKDHGEPFAAIFARYNHDFYAVDPHLFSPAEVVFQNIETGRAFVLRRGRPRRPDPLVLRRLTGRRTGLPLQATRTRIAALVSGFGWHVQDLAPRGRRARPRLDAVRFDSLVGHVGVAGRSIERRGRGAGGRRRRPDPDDAAGEPGAGHLPDGRAAPAGTDRESPC